MDNRFLELLKRIVENGSSDPAPVFEAVRSLLIEYDNLQLSHGLAQSVASKDLFKDGSILSQVLREENRLDSGFNDLDLAGCFQFGEYTVVGARPAMGKSLLLMNLALNMSKNVPVLYVSLDLSRISLIKRMLSCLSGIPSGRIEKGVLTEGEMQQLAAGEKELASRQLFVNDSIGNQVSHLLYLCSQHIERDGVRVIFIDYLQLLTANRYRQNRETEVSVVSRALKTLAKEHNVLVVVASQLSRSCEMRGGDKRPQLFDLRESGAIEQDADKVFFLYRPEYYGFLLDEEGNSTRSLAELILAKNRSGFLDCFRLKMGDYFTRFEPFNGYRNDFGIDPGRLDDLNDPDENPF